MITEADMLRVRGAVDKANEIGARIGRAGRWAIATPVRIVIIVAMVSLFGLAAIFQGIYRSTTERPRP